jgi:hypothetical protein
MVLLAALVLFCRPLIAQEIRFSQAVLTLPPPHDATVGISVWATTQTKSISELSVTLYDVKDPDGHSMEPLPLVVRAADSTSLTPAGMKLILTPERSWEKDGIYSAVFRFAGIMDDAPYAQTLPLAITRPPGALNGEGLSGTTFSVKRTFPWSPASISDTISLAEVSGLGTLEEMRFGAEHIFAEEKRRIRGSRFSVGPVPHVPGVAVDRIAPFDSLKIGLRMTGLRGAGLFDSAVNVNSPGLAEPVRIPIRLRVGDGPIFPLLVISLGVLLGYALSRKRIDAHQRQDLSYLLTELTGELVLWRRRAAATEKATKLQAIEDLLNESRRRLDREKFAAARQTLQDARKQMDAFRRDEVGASADMQKRLDTRIREIADYGTSDEVNEKERIELRALIDDLEDAGELLWNYRVDEVDAAVVEAEHRYVQIQIGALRRYLSEIDERREKIGPSEPEPLDKIRKEAVSALQRRDPAAARGHLNAYVEAVAELEEERRKASKQDGRKATSHLLAGIRADTHSSNVLHPLEVRPTAPEHRVSGEIITFSLQRADRLPLKADDRIEWNLGNHEGYLQGDHSIEFVYRSYGEYAVRARLRRDGDVILLGSTVVTILPNELQMKLLSIDRAGRRSAIALSTAALAISILAGLVYIYGVDPTFGTWTDYVGAFLLGFGVDSFTKGLANLEKLRPG